MKVLFLVNELLTVCGVSKHLYSLFSGLLEKENNKYFVICGGGSAISKFEDLGIDVIINKNIMHQNRSYTKFILATLQVSKFVYQQKIDVVHSHHHYSAKIAQVASIFKTTKNVMTNHGIIPEIGRINHFPSKNIITVNEHAFDYVKSHTNGKSIHLIRNGINEIDCSDQKQRAGIRVIVASRLIYEKGIDLFIKAVSLLPNEVTNEVTFYIAGEGIDMEDFIELDKKFKTNIKFVGAIDEMQKLLCSTHILVNPTISTMEGFPTILVEAGLQKNLIISSNFRGSNNTLINNRNSLLFNVGDINSLSENLLDSIQNFSKYKVLIDNFYSTCSRLYSKEVMVTKIEKIYE
jgi:glycosyltransferase involved in cell wall biosynthesis